MTPSPETESLAERYARLSREGVDRRGVDAALRSLDILISATVLVVTLPILALVTIVFLATSGTPLFYRGLRVGRHGRIFHMLKFRTLKRDAESRLGPYYGHELSIRTEAEVTRLGRWLRASQLDELPQLWNVLRGDMSIVGPRPERPYFVQQFKHRIPQYMLRHKVRAGITGWAQVNGWRGNTSLEKRIEYDLYYIENWSVSLDLKIMWLTLVRGLQKQAY
jgi:lipopolysaccharide/colanic/teichoic acid biosynthesis glycosyltransferase